MESLESILEPERTGVHGNADGKKTPWVLIAVILLVLVAGGAAAVMFLA
jgi:flagellar basal body-associated protein FliL